VAGWYAVRSNREQLVTNHQYEPRVNRKLPRYERKPILKRTQAEQKEPANMDRHCPSIYSIGIVYLSLHEKYGR